MKSKLIVFGLGVLLISSGYAFASEGHEHSEHKGSMMEEHGMMEHEHEGDADESEAIEVGNKICPVSGEEIGEDMGDPYQIEYDGKIYNLCCSMCAKDFQKDPEKFIKKINEELELENAEHDHNHEDHDH